LLTIPTGAAPGSYQFNITVRNSTTGCISANQTFNVTIASDPVINSQPALTQTFCVDGIGTLSVGVSGGVGSFTYQWYFNYTNSNSGGTTLGTFYGAQTNTLTIPTFDPDHIYYYCVVTQSGPGCNTIVSNTAEVTILEEPTTANAGSDQNNCGSSATLAANTPSIGSGYWSIITGVGGTVTTPTSPTSAFTGTAGTSYTLRWTISNAPCTASTDDVVLSLTANPTTANAGSDQNVCGTSATLAANTPSIGSGSWSIIAGTGGTVTTQQAHFCLYRNCRNFLYPSLDDLQCTMYCLN
jgi:hypothetical protein